MGIKNNQNQIKLNPNASNGTLQTFFFFAG